MQAYGILKCTTVNQNRKSETSDTSMLHALGNKEFRSVFPLLFAIFSHGFYLSPLHLVSAGWSCSCKVSDPGKKSPTAKYQSSTRHSLWYSDLKTPTGGSIGKGTTQE